MVLLVEGASSAERLWVSAGWGESTRSLPVADRLCRCFRLLLPLVGLAHHLPAGSTLLPPAGRRSVLAWTHSWEHVPNKALKRTAHCLQPELAFLSAVAQLRRLGTMNDPATFVEASKRLTHIFGRWPSFHDAEVIAVDLWRGDICPERNSWVGPVLTAKIQVLEATQVGAQHAGDDILATLRFHDVYNLQLLDFNHQNAIIELSLTREFPDGGRPPFCRVCFEQAFGIAASFCCSRVEVAAAEPFPQAERRA